MEAVEAVEVHVARLSGEALFDGRMPRDQSVGSLLQQVKLPTDSTLVVGSATVSATALVGDLVGEDGRVLAAVVMTGLELERRFHCGAFQLEADPGDAQEPLAEIFLPSDVEDPVASIEKTMSDKFGADCHIVSMGLGSDVTRENLLEAEDFRLLVKDRTALRLKVGHQALAPARLLQELAVEYGESNPTRCYTSAKLLEKEVVYHVVSQWGGKPVFDDSTLAKKPLWRPHRSRWSVGCANLNDGRVMEIGGEYEDYYDPMFCIFNDILVKYPDGRAPELYTYPYDEFPPTDGLACVQVDGHLYLLGNAGYIHERKEHMQVLIVDLETYSVKKPNTHGEGPAWCSIRQMSPVKSSWEFGAAGCYLGWQPPEDLCVKLEFSFKNGRAEAYVSGLFFGIVVRLKQFQENFDPQSDGGPTDDTCLVKEDAIPQISAVLGISDFDVVHDAGTTNWIVAKVNGTLGVVYQPSHDLQIGMILDLDRDRQSSPGDMHVRRADGSYYGLLRERRYVDGSTGLQCADQTMPGSDYLDAVTSDRVVDSDNIEDITAPVYGNICAYRPLSLFLAEAAAKEAAVLGDPDSEAVQTARDRLTQAVDRVKLLAPMENELVNVDERSKNAVLEKWGLGEASQTNPKLEGRDIAVKIYPGPRCWRLNVDTFLWSEVSG